jgi:hypothetical protein
VVLGSIACQAGGKVVRIDWLPGELVGLIPKHQAVTKQVTQSGYPFCAQNGVDHVANGQDEGEASVFISDGARSILV